MHIKSPQPPFFKGGLESSPPTFPPYFKGGLESSSPPFEKGGLGGISRFSGFTLIELLIVIVIISIVASFAVLSISFNQNKQLESLTNQLVNILTLTEQEAMLRPTTLGVAINKNNLQIFDHHAPKDPKDNPWQLLADSLLNKQRIPKDVQITLKIQGKTVSSTQPRIIISSSGDLTPFTLLIGKKDAKPRYQITGEANGNIKSGPINEE